MSKHYSVKECLHGYTEEALGAICDRWQLVAKNKPSRIRAIEKVLEDPLHVHRMLKTVDADVIRLVRIVASRSYVSATDLIGVHGLYTLTNPLGVVANAVQLGLLLACPEGRAGAFSISDLSRDFHSDSQGALLSAPELVGRLLPQPLPLGISIPEVPAPAVVEKCHDTSTFVLLELLRIVDLIAPRVTSSGALHKSDESRALELCKEAGLPSEALSLALMSAHGLGCIEIRDGHLVTLPQAERWVEQSRAERARSLFSACLRAEEIPDVRLFFPQLIDALEKRLVPGSVRRTYHRRLVATVLGELSPGHWYRVDDFVDALFKIDRNCLFVEEKWRAIQSNMHDVSPSWMERQWQLREMRLFAWMIRRLLRDMSMIELGEEESVFQITPIGAYALGFGEVPEESQDSSKDALVVQPDFEIIVYADSCPARLRRKLDLFCDRLRSGVVSTYKLSQESVYRGVRSGTSAAEFLALLDQNGRHAVPANIRELIEGWERKSGVISIYGNCRVLECRTAEELDHLLPKLTGVRRIGDRFILFQGSEPPTSATVISYVEARRPCLQQEDGLQLRIPWLRADLFVARSLSGLGELVQEISGDVVLRLSREKLGQSRDWGLVAAELEALSEKPLSARFKMALRAWSGDLGSVTTRNATLVRFEDPDTCSAILELPELAPHIEGRIGLYTLVVKQGQLTAFRNKVRKINLIVEAANQIVDPQTPDVWAPKWVEEHRSVQPIKVEEAATQTKEKPAKRYEKALPSYSPRIVGEVLADAISRRRPVLIEYQSAWSSEPSVRRVDPVTLDTSGSIPSLSGYCHVHKGPRTFKLAQILGIRVLETEAF